MMRILTGDDLQLLVPMSMAIRLMKQVFADLSMGRTTTPPRTFIDVPNQEGYALFMPSDVPTVGGLGIKAATVFPRNRLTGKPIIHAVVLMFDPETGEPAGLLDGRFLTALRTGAAVGAATDLLARPDSRVLTIIGPGAQGLTQAWAVATVRQIDKINVFGTNPVTSRSFADRLRAYDGSLAEKVVPVDDPHRAVRESDIVCTATTAGTPVFRDEDVPAGLHINGTGGFNVEIEEIPAETIARSYLVADSVDAVAEEGGDVLAAIACGLLPRERLHIELGHVVEGIAPRRTDAEQITFFKSVGSAVQDMIIARSALDAAADRGLGHQLSFSPSP